MVKIPIRINIDPQGKTHHHSKTTRPGKSDIGIRAAAGSSDINHQCTARSHGNDAEQPSLDSPDQSYEPYGRNVRI